MPMADDQPIAAKTSTSMSASLSLSGATFRKPPSAQPGRSDNLSLAGNGCSLNTEDLAKYLPIEPLDLAKSLVEASSTLVIDIRPSTSFALARIRGSINLCAPSTLLKRVGVTVERIEEEMLSSQEDQLLFSGWRCGPQKDGTKRINAQNGVKPIERIVVLDTDTNKAEDAGKPSAGGGGPCLIGVLRKFDLAGYAGQLLWLVGGFNSFNSKIGAKTEANDLSDSVTRLIDAGSLDQKKGQGSAKGAVPSLRRGESQRRSSVPISKGGPSMSPQSSQMSGVQTHSLVHPRGLPMEAFSLTSTTRRSSLGAGRRTMQTSSSHPTFDVDGLPAAGDSTSFACANPFFDNIRQNRELQHGITEKIPLDLPAMTPSELALLPAFLRQLVDMDDEKRAEVLAQKFFDVEKAEQRRLIATMQQHAAESSLDGNSERSRSTSTSGPSGALDALQLSSPFSSVSTGLNCDNSSMETFPFSIAAALERGSENRYNNIWTYEHSRIRFSDSSVYLNGSYIEPAREYGCKRRYIATQAPLPSTFAAFWSVVWQQNARTICMITREFESGRVQSHNYWSEGQYGDMQLKVVEVESLDSAGQTISRGGSLTTDKTEGGYHFPSKSVEDDANGAASSVSTIKRRFVLSKDGEQREITQLQFVAWPDYSIPEDALGILNYMDMANNEQAEASEQVQRTSKAGQVGPIVVHCSAGVGRTGTYIVIDSVLDVLRSSRGRRVSGNGLGRGESIMLSSSATWTAPPSIHRQPRKSLKRELSPSAMDIDASEGERKTTHARDNTTASPSSNSSNNRSGDTSSPPPLQRSRSDEADQESPALSLSALGSPSSGTETPSSAMGKMHIGWDSLQHTPTKSTSTTAPHSDAASNQNGEGPPSIAQAGGAPMSVDASPGRFEDDQVDDLIQRTVETIREQRMSTVQTTRQYVFTYQAVLEGLLREARSAPGAPRER